MSECIARVHVDDYDPEVYHGEAALLMANAAAAQFREDFPGSVIGVSYNPEAAASATRLRLVAMGLESEGQGA